MGIYGRELGKELLKHKAKGEEARCAITTRSITLNDKNFNFFNGHFWQLDISRRGRDDVEENDNKQNDPQTETQM